MIFDILVTDPVKYAKGNYEYSLGVYPVDSAVSKCYHVLTTIDIDIDSEEHNTAILQLAIDKLGELEKETVAELEMKLNAIRNQKAQLLSITHQPTNDEINDGT